MARQKTTKRTVLRLRQLRREREMTQAELAHRVSLTVSTICAIERGQANPSFESALAIARVFNRPVEEVFGRVEVPA